VLWAAGILVAVVAGALAWAMWPAPAPAPRAREYLDYNVCLLTDADGLRGNDAAPVWAGMQDASLATRVRVQYLTVSGAQTAGNAEPLLASLAQSKCALVFTTGSAPTTAARSNAGSFANVRFYVLGGASTVANLTVLPRGSNDQVRQDVRRAVTSAAPTS
jgi:hypothetical protein